MLNRGTLATLLACLLIGCIQTPRGEVVLSDAPFAPKAGKISADDFVDLFAESCMKSTPDFLPARAIFQKRGFSQVETYTSESYPDETSITMKDTKRGIEADFGSTRVFATDPGGDPGTVITSCSLSGPVKQQETISLDFLSEKLGIVFLADAFYNNSAPGMPDREGRSTFQSRGNTFSVYNYNGWLIFKRSIPHTEMPSECGDLPECRVWMDTSLTIQLMSEPSN